MKRIAIHSAPRSGSTWLGAIFDSHPAVIYKYQPLFSYRFKSALSEHSSEEEIGAFFNMLSQTDDDFLDQKEQKAKGIIPSFEKRIIQAIVYKEVRYHYILSNLLEKDKDLRVIGLVRNPLATINSWLQAPREFRADLNWEITKEWRFAPKKNLNRKEEFNGYEKWKEVTLLFEQLNDRFSDRFYLLNYATLLDSPLDTVQKLFSFSGLQITKQTCDFISESTKRSVKNAYGVYKKKNEDIKWKNELPTFITDAITEDLEGTSLAKYL